MLKKLSVRIFLKPPNLACLYSQFIKNYSGETTMTWETEKEKFVKMTASQKKGPSFKIVTVSTIPTWKTIFQNKTSELAKEIPRLPRNTINPAMNKELADKISYYKGDITHLEVDAIVNAANKSLLGGGGVDGAIHRTAGHFLLQECKTLMGCNVGEAKITGGYELPAKYVIHTVGPQGEKPDLLSQCYKNSLKLFFEQNLRTIAFPCISTGIYGYPLEPAAHVAVNEVRSFLESNSSKVDRIIFCLFADQDVTIYQGVLQSYFPLK
ncbi:macro domain-containing protein CT2219-like [Onthophagus taurus]|uniref:macro domain-containing protein CT2219-like n=1 Tax=Onthophagus taurus TaxID=166361 RepID=UPI000C1FF610|nr:uncharacterized protein LOC111418496 [Onthophagus taurus]